MVKSNFSTSPPSSRRLLSHVNLNTHVTRWIPSARLCRRKTLGLPRTRAAHEQAGRCVQRACFNVHVLGSLVVGGSSWEFGLWIGYLYNDITEVLLSIGKLRRTSNQTEPKQTRTVFSDLSSRSRPVSSVGPRIQMCNGALRAQDQGRAKYRRSGCTTMPREYDPRRYGPIVYTTSRGLQSVSASVSTAATPRGQVSASARPEEQQNNLSLGGDLRSQRQQHQHPPHQRQHCRVSIGSASQHATTRWKVASHGVVLSSSPDGVTASSKDRYSYKVGCISWCSNEQQLHAQINYGHDT